MTVLEIQFIAGRYHATPWDAHVNEGRIDWPPSPWRLVRALVAVGYTKHHWPDEPPTAAVSMIEKLASQSPAYSLPPAFETHTRHYMPVGSKPAKVLDAFLRFERRDASLLVHYDLELDADETEWLGRLAESLGYLGRAESWVDARLLDRPEAERVLATELWCVGNGAQRGEGSGRTVRCLAGVPTDTFAREREAWLERALPIAEAKAAAKKRSDKPMTASARKKLHTKVAEKFPRRPLDSLRLDTSRWQANGWPQPPGTCWSRYVIPEDAIRQQPLVTIARDRRPTLHDCVLLSVDGDGKRGTIRPSIKRIVPLAEVLHRSAVCGSAQILEQGNVPEVTGKELDGTPVRDHRHVHYIGLSLFGRDRIDHVLAWCPAGMPQETVDAIATIRRAYSKDISQLHINVAGLGKVGELVGQLSRAAKVRARSLDPLRRSTCFESDTPIVFAKYLHRRGKKRPDSQIRDELRRRGFDDPEAIELHNPQETFQRRLKGFVICRSDGKPQPPMATSWSATIRFAKPQQGPICLGYGSHFGLGVFRAVNS